MLVVSEQTSLYVFEMKNKHGLGEWWRHYAEVWGSTLTPAPCTPKWVLLKAALPYGFC